MTSASSNKKPLSSGGFISRFTHDLRTPINHIIGYSEIVSEEIADNASYKQFLPDLQKIQAAGRELLRQVSEDMDSIHGEDIELSAALNLLREHSRMALDQVIGYSEILIKEVEGQDSLIADLTKISVAGKQLIMMINEGIELSQLSQKEIDPRKTTQTTAVVSEDKHSDRGYILVVDDNEINRDMLSRRLLRAGYTVTLAENARQALDLIKVQKFDLVILDILMPEIDGLEMLSIIRETRSIVELPIIMATAKDQTADVVEGLHHGANDYVTKPIDMPILLARMETQLQLKRLSQLKDEFLSIASHDLKNPLTTILMSGYLARDMVPIGKPMTEHVYQMLEFIVRRGEEMQAIIRDFLDFQAVEDGNLRLERTPVNLNIVALSMVENNAHYARDKNIKLTTDLDTALPTVNADIARLSQVAQNYVGNAIKFSPSGSTATIRTRRENDAIFFEVIDNGPGLTPDDMKHAFVKYARLSNKPTGSEHSSGLGLAICRQMIELHNGQVGVRNNSSGSGATFWFSLPGAELPAK